MEVKDYQDAIVSFKVYILDMSGAMHRIMRATPVGELKELYKTAAFTYDEIYDDMVRHFRPLV